jgi:polysaccharide export outer membrane protein
MSRIARSPHRLTRRAGCAALVGLLGVLAAGCTPGSDLPPMEDYRAASYRLGGGDRIRIITFGEEQLTGEFGVDDQGNIALPLLGTVKAAGLTPVELGARISEGLRQKKLLRDPSVAVEVLAYRPIFVLGEVAKPGQYPYQPGMTMLTAVAVAGGFTYRGVQDYASVVRTTGGPATEGKVVPRSLIAPGDVINVFERRF